MCPDDLTGYRNRQRSGERWSSAALQMGNLGTQNAKRPNAWQNSCKMAATDPKLTLRLPMSSLDSSFPSWKAQQHWVNERTCLVWPGETEAWGKYSQQDLWHAQHFWVKSLIEVLKSRLLSCLFLTLNPRSLFLHKRYCSVQDYVCKMLHCFLFFKKFKTFPLKIFSWFLGWNYLIFISVNI